MADEIDAMALYRARQQLDNGHVRKLERVSEPDELRDITAFYRLVQPHVGKPVTSRLFAHGFAWAQEECHPTSGQKTGANNRYLVGKAFCNSGRINEGAVSFQLIRADRTSRCDPVTSITYSPNPYMTGH